MIKGKPLNTKTYRHRMISTANQGKMTASKAASIQHIDEAVKAMTEANPVEVLKEGKKGGKNNGSE